MTRDPAPDAAGSRSFWTLTFLLVFLTLAALGGVVRNGFVNYDDDLYLTANPSLSDGPAGDRLAWAFTTTRGGNWHPLTWVSHLIDVRFFGMNPGAHHAMSLALHTTNVLLLFALLRGLTRSILPSALVAALFAVHPLHVESVAWAAERKDVLSTSFALGAALLYVRGVRRPAGIAMRAAVPLLFTLALLAKPMPLTLPLLLLLLDWWPLGRWSPTSVPPAHSAPPRAGYLPPLALWREKAPLFLLAAVSGAITWKIQSDAGAMQATAGISLPARAGNAFIAYARYLRKTLWPDDLAVFYPYPWDGHPPLAVGFALALVTALTVLCFPWSRRRPWLPVGMLWYLISLLPVIGLVQVGEQAMADRYTYLPLVGIFIAAAWGISEIAGNGRRSATAVVVATLLVIGILAVITSRQVVTWRDGAAVFSQALAVTRDNYIAHNNLGTALLARGKAAESLPHFEATIRIAPGSPKGYLNLGRALAELGRHDEAVGWFRQAIAGDANDPLAHRNLALSLERLGRREEAIPAYRTSLRLQPHDPRTLDLLGVALARNGRAGEAVPLLERAAGLDPGNQSIREHLAVAKAQLASSQVRGPIIKPAGP